MIDNFPFTNPFRYVPHPLVKKAAGEIMDVLESWSQAPEGSPLHSLEQSFAEGKMLGVLLCKDGENTRCLYAFSGTVRGTDGKVTSTVEGFVPSIIDLTDSEGFFKRKEAEISHINRQIALLSSSPRLQELQLSLIEANKERDREIQDMQTRISFSKMRRDEIRTETADSNVLEELVRESQFQKAELKRIKDKWKSCISEIENEILEAKDDITKLKMLRAGMSDDLQKWIFDNAIVHNALGASTSIWDLFQSAGLTPPGGTGDCAAPKLLEYAYKHGLQPLAMGEFWYGKSPETAVRTHGHFYPSCSSKCGPLLSYMMQGLHLEQDEKTTSQSPVIIHEDDNIIVVEKPSAMPSVPGLDGRLSLLEWLNNRGVAFTEAVAVHRLDMDTSGLMIFAKNREAEINLKKQFEEHSVRKTYIARLDSQYIHTAGNESSGTQVGSINLPLSADYDERPRQKVDFRQGKPAHTEYEIINQNPDGTTDVQLHPYTGRTHQLRVHCAHTLGLGSPIVGDLLYGSHTTKNDARGIGRLCLHALSITFCHPQNGEEITFTSRELCW